MAQSHDPPRTVLLAGSVLLGRVPRWVFDAPLLLACVAVLMDPDLRLRREFTGSGSIRRTVATLAVAGFGIAAGFLIPAWASGGVMPGRLLNWLYLILITAVLGSALLLKPVWVHPRWLRSAALAATFLAAAYVGNPRPAASDLASRVRPWSEAKLDALHRLSQGSRAFPQLPEVPHLFFDYDVNTNPSSHPNVCVARYYGLPSVAGPEALTTPDGAELTGRLYRRR